MYRRLAHIVSICAFAGTSFLLLCRCDTVEPIEDPLLVVEGYLNAGQYLPTLMLRQTTPMSRTYATEYRTTVSDADVLVYVDGASITYRPEDDTPGRYEPDSGIDPVLVPPRSAFGLDVRWRDQHATVEGWMPPIIAIDSIQIEIPDDPVQAVLLDSLQFTDSLRVRAHEGYIYPIEVSVWWTVDQIDMEQDSLYWIETQLKPYTTFSSALIDFFLLPEQVFQEKNIPFDFMNQRYWTGVYAIPVEERTDPVPLHGLKVTLLRSGRDYARFATSRNAPRRREPVSNVDGALGIFVGISIDSLSIRVE